MKNTEKYNPTFLALDLGGTKLLVGEVTSKGEILNYKKYDTGYINQNCALEIIKNSISDYVQTTGWATELEPEAIGIGLIGRVDNRRGIWYQIDTERTTPLYLADELYSKFGLPCYIDNDVKSATRAEQLWGHGCQSNDFIYINIGTGIAAGIVTDGKLIRGSHCNAGEVGHTTVGVVHGIDCVCERCDCVELIASGIGFDKSARILMKHNKTRLSIRNDERVDTREIFQLYEQGDKLCKVLVDDAAEAISSLIMNLVRVSDPDTVVLGGGIASNEFFYEKVLQRLNKNTIRFVTNGVVLTKLDPSFIGLIGAAAVAMNK